MLEKLEHRGEWFLAETREHRVTGILTFDQETGGRLDLNGTLRPDSLDFSLGTIPFLYGITTLGVYVTLINSFTRGFSLGLQTTSAVHVGMILEGAHFANDADILFKKLTVRYSHLEDWLLTTGLGFAFNPAEQSCDIFYRTPPAVTVAIREGLCLDISFGASVNAGVAPLLNISVTHEATATFVAASGEQLEQALSTITRFCNFLTLGVDSVCVPKSIRGTVDATNEKGESQLVDVRVFYQLPHRSGINTERVQAPRMLFTFQDVQHRFEVVIQKWYQSSERISPTHELFFSQLQNPGVLENRFLNLTQALESYHRRTFGNEDRPPEEYERMMHRVREVLPEYPEWLERLKHLNEPGLRKRLKQLLRDCPGVAELICDKINTFAGTVYETRNHLTHHGTAEAPVTVDGLALYRLSEQLELLVRYCLLRDIGFACDVVTPLVGRYCRHNMKTFR